MKMCYSIHVECKNLLTNWARMMKYVDVSYTLTYFWIHRCQNIILYILHSMTSEKIKLGRPHLISRSILGASLKMGDIFNVIRGKKCMLLKAWQLEKIELGCPNLVIRYILRSSRCLRMSDIDLFFFNLQCWMACEDKLCID